MLRSMYSGISGLKNFQTKLDVIGNNIANVNTHGFKKGRVIFKDLYSQTVAGASGPTTTRGGVNPKQVGLGSQLGSIDTVHAGGSTQFTGNTLDLAIEGDGFFIVADGEGNPPTGYGKISYTRAGNFYFDNAGYLVNADGKYLYGYANNVPDKEPGANDATLGEITQVLKGESTVPGTPKPIKIPPYAESMSIGADGTVSYVAKNGLNVAGKIIMGKFSNPGGLEKEGSNYYNQSMNSGEPNFGYGSEVGLGVIKSGSLEMSNVDLGEEFTEMIVAQRGFQANTRIITTSDEILQELVNLKR